MRTANCPSCGAQVAFRAAASVLAVCEFCHSTLLRRGADIENIGKMAELAEDASLVRLGTEGVYKGVHFAVIGRIQLQHGRGYWNEWHLLYDSQRTGWLGEGYGRAFMTQLRAVKEAVPPFESLKVGAEVVLDGHRFTVAGLDRARCVAGEGELPFRVGAGYDVQTADLYGGAYFATIDYSETPPFVFIGEQVDSATLKLTHTRDVAAIAVAAEAIQCTGCGAALNIHARGIETVACGSCGAVLDATDKAHKIIQQLQHGPQVVQRIPLGAKGRLHGADYEVIGYLVRKIVVDGEAFRWGEYLLFNPVEGFRWLTEYRGHWNFAKPTRNLPTLSQTWTGHPTAVYLGQTYRHFQTASAEVEYVVGEFYWQIRAGDTNEVADYINPPLLVSAESGDNELVWSVSEYTPSETIAAAFKLKSSLPEPQGVFANQPAPVTHSRYWKVFAQLTAVALLIHLAFAFGGGKKVYDKEFVLPPRPEATVQSEEFVLGGRASNVVVRNSSNLQNNWIFVTITLIEKERGKVYRVGREMSFYSGPGWSEGNRSDEAIFTGIPAGRYYLSIEAERPRGRLPSLYHRVEVIRDVPAWSNFWILAAALFVIPLLTFFRKSAFESARWAESDYAAESDDSDYDDC